MALPVGMPAPGLPGAAHQGPHALVFFKVTCTTTQIAAPALERLGSAYPGRVTGIVQDPAEDITDFGETYCVTFPMAPDLAPYDASNAYQITVAPTVIVIDGEGKVADVAESWDREAFNRTSATLAALLGTEPVAVSDPGDGLPDFKPG